MDRSSENDAKRVADEESDALLLRAFLTVITELKEDFSLGGNYYFSRLPYLVSGRERLIDALKWMCTSDEGEDLSNVLSEGPEGTSTLLEECIKGLYELVDRTVEKGRQNNLSLLGEVLDSALHGAFSEYSHLIRLFRGHMSMALYRVLIALGKPVGIPEIVGSLIEFTSDETRCWVEWRECAGHLLSEVDDQLKAKVGETLADLCESSPQIWKRCRELLEESYLNDDYDGLLFGALYSRIVNGGLQGKDCGLDRCDLYLIEGEGRRLYFKKDLVSLVRLFRFVASLDYSWEDERFFAHENVRNSLSEDVAGILFYYVDMLERYSDTEGLRMALLKMTALLGLYCEESNALHGIKALCLDKPVSRNDLAGESLPVGSEGSKMLANSYAHLARCVLPFDATLRAIEDDYWRRYYSARNYYKAASETLRNSHTWSLLDSARDYNVDEFSRREVIVGECSKLSALFSDLLGKLEKDVHKVSGKSLGVLNDSDFDEIHAFIDACHIYCGALDDETRESDLPFLDYVKTVLAIEEALSESDSSEKLRVIESFTACYALIHDLLRVSRYSRHLLSREGESGLFAPLFRWIEGSVPELCEVFSNRWPSCHEEIHHLVQDCADGKHRALSRRTNAGEELLYYCSLQNMLYLFDEMKVAGRGRGLHAERAKGSWFPNKGNDEFFNCLTVMNANYLNDPTEGGALFQWLAGDRKTIFGESVDMFRGASVSGRLAFIKSFTSSYDRLNMWSLYGSSSSNRQCDGCCVELDPVTFLGYGGQSGTADFLARYVSSEMYFLQSIRWLWDERGENNILRNIFYIRREGVGGSVIAGDRLRLTSLLRHWINAFSGILKNAGGNRSETAKVVRKHLAEQLSLIAYLYKDESYSSENEKRLILFYDTDPDSLAAIRELPSAGPGQPRRLCVNPAFPIYIKSITFGSNVPRVEEWIPDVRYLLGKMKIRAKKRGIEIDPEIKFSKIPIR